MSTERVKCLIIGSGPAGYTAAGSCAGAGCGGGEAGSAFRRLCRQVPQRCQPAKAGAVSENSTLRSRAGGHRQLPFLLCGQPADLRPGRGRNGGSRRKAPGGVLGGCQSAGCSGGRQPSGGGAVGAGQKRPYAAAALSAAAAVYDL